MTPLDEKLLSHLTADACKAATAALTELHRMGFGKITVIETFRTSARQWKLYGQGRSVAQIEARGGPGYTSRLDLPVVTYLTPVDDLHCKRVALDVSLTEYPRNRWPEIAHIFKQHGFTWGGDWHMRDCFHFQFDAR